MSLPILPISAAALRLPIGRFGFDGELRSPAGPSWRSRPQRTRPCASKKIVWPARTSMPVSFHATSADTITCCSRMPDGRPPDEVATVVAVVVAVVAVAPVLEVDAIDLVAIDPQGAPAAKAAPLFEFDLAVANGDQLALNPRAVAEIERVGLQADGQRQQRWPSVRSSVGESSCILLRTVCREFT